ncbi:MULTISPECIES: M60 family metallopeptidase [unclassified Streptomyces]|uniref:M60 family metallopeptidase n=1 Tax=unclassified Streptomyces TaxID=2593676 RepID=UPI0038005E6A
MRPARTPSTAPVARPAAPPLPRYGGGPASEASDCSAFRAMNRRTVLGALAGAGAATLLGAGSAAARQAGSEAGTRAGHGSGDTLLIKAFPDAEKERMRLARALRSSDFIPTGRYASAGEPVSVTVRPAGGRVPTLHIGTFDYYNTESALQEPRATPLRPGRNTVGDAHGGPIYLSFAGEGERAAVTFGPDTPRMAVFELGRTDEAAFQKQLDEKTGIPWVELITDQAILTLTREGALLYRGEDHTRLMELFDTVIDSHARISGLDGRGRANRPKAGRYHFNEVGVVPSGVGAYAWHGYNGFPRAYMDRLCTVSGLGTRGWGLYHELGHLHQQGAYQADQLTEVTVNIYSLAAQRTLGQTSNLLTVDPKTGLNPYQSALPKLGTSGIGYEKTFGAYEKLIPLRQLELAFGEDFWPRLHRLVRSEHQHDAPVDDYTHDPAVNARQYLALASYAGRTAGYDLTDFFVHKWALPIDSAGVAALAALGLPKPSVDPSTLTD